jgi:DNA-binding NarL/FixJ family response regulator
VTTLPLSVAIVDDHPVAVEGMRAQLEEAGFDVVASASTVEQLSLDNGADVVICDLSLPGRSGPSAVSFLVEAGHAVLATSGVAVRAEIVGAVAAGARGFIAKTAPAKEFARGVRSVVGTGRFVSAELANALLVDAEARPLPKQDIGPLAKALLSALERGETSLDAAASLGIEAEVVEALLARVWECAARRQRLNRPSPREAELLRLAGQGLSYKALATSMGISVNTVADMLQRLKAKYLASHPGAAVDIAPLVAARLWASERGAL